MTRNLKTLAIGVAATLALAAPAMAQDSGFHVGVSADAIDFDTFGIGFRGGYDFTEYVGVELQGIQGVGTNVEEEITADIGSSFDTSLAAFAVVKAPVGVEWEIFGRVGVHTTRLDSEASFTNPDDQIFDFNYSIDTSGLVFGAGAQYFLDDFNGVRFEYTSFDLGDVGIDDVRIGGVSDAAIRDAFDLDGVPDDEEQDAGTTGVFSVSYVRRF